VASLAVVVLILSLACGCSKIPSDELCAEACKKYVELTGTAKREALSGLPQEYKDKYDQKIASDGKPIVDACVERCKVEGSIAAADCLVEARMPKDLESCRLQFGVAK
jgi:hypothetical protein